MDIIVSVVVIASLVALAVWLGRRLVGPDFSLMPVAVGILAAVGFAAALYPINIWLRIDTSATGHWFFLAGGFWYR